MIFEQLSVPIHAQIGDAWVCPHKSFKRVLSRGGAWENVNLGSKHPDEKERDDEQGNKSEAEQRVDGTKVPIGAGEPSSGDGNDGQVPGSGHVGEGSENTGVKPDTSFDEAGIDPEEIPPEGEGVDGNGSPVV